MHAIDSTLHRLEAVPDAGARLGRGAATNGAGPGKVVIDGVAQIGGEKVFALQFLQARNADWVRKPFYAKFDPNATWMDELKPAFGKEKFFFEEEGGARSELGGASSGAPGSRKVIPLISARHDGGGAGPVSSAASGCDSHNAA